MNQKLESWIFTFGFAHTHPFTGESLNNCFIEIIGTIESTRMKMIERFGNQWGFQYRTREDAGVDTYNLTEIEWINTVKKDK